MSMWARPGKCNGPCLVKLDTIFDEQHITNSLTLDSYIRYAISSFEATLEYLQRNFAELAEMSQKMGEFATALATGSVQVVECCFKNAENENEVAELMNYSSHEGNNSLIVSVINSHLDLFIYLSGKGLDINHQNLKGDTALHYCSKNNLIEFSTLIRNDKRSLILRNVDGYSALHQSLIMGHEKITEILASPDSVNLLTNLNESAFMFVKTRRDVELMFTNGGNANVQPYFDIFPFLYHCKSGNIAVATAFCEFGDKFNLNFEVSDEKGRNFLHFCSHLNLIGPISQFRCLLIKNPKKYTRVFRMITHLQNNCLHAASFAGNFECLRLLLDMGLDPWKRNSQGYTPAELSTNDSNRTYIEGT